MMLAATGDATGIVMPASSDALAADATGFLTRAFHAYGNLGEDNAVAAVTRLEAFAGGNSGHKALIDVVYARPAPSLPTRLFAKFSRDFEDPFRDRRRFELDGEVRLAALSRHPRFPVAVARPMFGDFEAATGTGLLITERISFGEGAIEPLRAKCMDRLLPDPLEYYRVLVSAQARLAAAHLSGALSPEVDALFPYDRLAAEADLPIISDAAVLRGKLSSAHPHLFPPGLARRMPDLEAEALAIHAREAEVRRFLQSDPRLVALAHWNTNIDNAWFWRGPDGALDSGLLDWGMVRVMNLTTGLWGGLSASDTDFLPRELPGLLAHWRAELAAHGGPDLPGDLVDRHFDLSLAITGLSLMLDLPALVTARLPNIAEASGPHDPLLRRDKVVEGFLLVTSNFLALWSQRRFARHLATLG